jgi:HEPN domain-containing protein
MSDPEQLRELARWLRYAEDDLRIAELILAHGEVPRAACFNAQQCAEKSLKASLIFLQIPYPKTHNLDRLHDLLPEGWAVKGKFPDLARLSGWAVEPRYPGDFIEATGEDAATAIDQAKEIFETTVNELERRGYRSDISGSEEDG